MIPQFVTAFFRRWRKSPEECLATLLVKPSGEGAPVWWPKDEDGYIFVSIDPRDPPGWSAGIDPAYEFDSTEVWIEFQATIEEHVEELKEEWLDEHEECQHVSWEFELLKSDKGSEIYIAVD